MINKVLICDDEPNILESLAYVIKKKGLGLLTAVNGLEAVELAQKETPDLIILDVGMPEMDGYQACKQLRNNPVTTHAHIIILTAHGQRSDEFSAIQAGADEFLTKPFSPRFISQRIEQLMVDADDGR